jgi:hypothetical protein
MLDIINALFWLKRMSTTTSSDHRPGATDNRRDVVPADPAYIARLANQQWSTILH